MAVMTERDRKKAAKKVLFQIGGMNHHHFDILVRIYTGGYCRQRE